MWSQHDNNKEDRIFEFQCGAMATRFSLVDCEWTDFDFTHKFDDPELFILNCSWDGVIRSEV